MKRIYAICAAVLLLLLASSAAWAENTYKLKLTYEDDIIPENILYYEAGAEVILEPDIGMVRPAQKNHIGLDRWEEQNLPAGASKVKFDYEPHPTSVNLQVCSFIMPARDVELKAYFEERHVIVYKLSEDQKKGVQYHCLPGAKTPPYSLNGSDPVRPGYVFTGWLPEPGERLTGSIRCIAQWEKWEPIEAKAVGSGVEFRIPVDVKAFDPDNLCDEDGYKLEHKRDFTYREGSTIIELTPEYLKKKADKSEIEITASFVTIDQDSNKVTHPVKVSVPNVSADIHVPQTGDRSSLFVWCGVLCAALVLLRRRAIAG